MKNYSFEKIFDILFKDRKKGVAILYSEYYNKLYGIAFSFAKNRQTSEDAVQNVIYKLLTLDLDKLPKDNILSWLYRVIKNEVSSIQKKESKKLSVDFIEEIGVSDKNIDEYVDMDEFFSIIKPLDAKRQEIVALKILGGYTHKEIAEMLGEKQGTVQWLYNTAINKLKILLISLTGMIVAFVGGLVGLFIKLTEKPSGNEKPPMVSQIEKNIIVLHIVIIAAIVLALSMLIVYVYKKVNKKTKI